MRIGAVTWNAPIVTLGPAEPTLKLDAVDGFSRVVQQW
jgi:hypothetical protein